jgi:hypothetical protein
MGIRRLLPFSASFLVDCFTVTTRCRRLIVAVGLSSEVIDDGTTEVLAGLELVEDRVEIRERADPRDVALHLARGGEIDQPTAE